MCTSSLEILGVKYADFASSPKKKIPRSVNLESKIPTFHILQKTMKFGHFFALVSIKWLKQQKKKHLMI